MKRSHQLVPAVLALLALLFTGVAWAEKSKPHAPVAASAGAPEEAGHGQEHGVDHGPGPINWYYGLISESDDQEPSLLFRPKGMQPPLAALFLNAGILFYVIVRVGRRPLTDALKKRKISIMQGMDDAARMRDDAAERLAEYEEKLERIDDEVERIKREMREAGEIERERILAEAKERSLRMERDARMLIEQELTAARQDLIRQAVEGAVKSASERLIKEIGVADHARIADEYLGAIDKAVVTKGGEA